MLIIGSDPEVFLRDSNNQLVNALTVLPGSKHNPFKTKNGYIQPDNILAEFNSNPSASLEEFIINHNAILSDLLEYIAPLNLSLDFVASAIASDSILNDLRTRIAGCEPDYCVWRSKILSKKAKLAVNKPADYSSTNLRAAGGHLHISFDQADKDSRMINRFKFIKALDYNLGIPAILYDRDQQRRTIYGKAGAFRPKFINQGDSYNGVEYRTLSNFWLKSNNLMEWVYNKVEEVYLNLDYFSEMANLYSKEVQEIINLGDYDNALSFCEERKIQWNM